MFPITVSAAFGNAPPRRPCVLCLKGKQGGADMILTEWFSWLNIRRNPMISFSLPRDAAFGTDLREGDSFALAFPPADTAKKYKKGISISADNCLPIASSALPIPIPADSEIVLTCNLAGAYNYPFKKIRIFNCNLDEAFGDPESIGF